MSAGLASSKQIIIHGFITNDGQKMSKSIGNVVDPLEIIKEYGVDALRYYLAREVTPFEDGDFTVEKFKEAYNANLVNGLGNLVSRTMKMASQYLDAPVNVVDSDELLESQREYIEKFELNRAMDFLWGHMAILDGVIQEEKPFEIIKTNRIKAQKLVTSLAKELYKIAKNLKPFMPDTANTIQKLIKENKMPEEPLFPRK